MDLVDSMVDRGELLFERPEHNLLHIPENLLLYYLIRDMCIFLISFLVPHDVHSGLQSIYL